MTKEEQIKQKFKETYPEFMRGDKPLSPFFDIWEYAIEIATKELESQIEKMKSQYDYAFNQLCESREIICSMLSQYRDKKEIDYSIREHGEKLLKQGVYKND